MKNKMPRILIVDDESENRKALRLALGDENPDWEIFEAESDSNALALITSQLQQRKAIDLVLTDLVMSSEESGMNLLSTVHKLDPFIMALLFTAKEKSLDRYAALEIGAFDVVEKNIRGTSAVKEINFKARAALRYREWSQRINFLRRYFDPNVFATIENDPDLLPIRLRTVSIVFWDIRGFSGLCEILKGHPSLIADFLRDYCENAARVIFEHGGVLDKFIGDGVMALFGVPQRNTGDGTEEARAAVRTALAMKDVFDVILGQWQDKWTLYSPQSIDIGLGCGIHTGEALVGNVGTAFREQFTALGPHVNLASRIEARAKSGQILVSQSTEKRVRSEFRTKLEAELKDIKNIPGEYKVYLINGIAVR